MAHQVAWNKPILDEFIRIGGLTDEETDVIKTRVKGYSITKQAMELGMSISKINMITKRLKIKYDNVQRYSDILPIRQKCTKDLY